MKIGYVMVFGKMKMNIDLPPRSMVEAWHSASKRITELAGKYGLKVLLLGGPLGMSEDVVVVFEVGGSIDGYLEFKEETFSQLPFTDMRTHPIVVP